MTWMNVATSLTNSAILSIYIKKGDRSEYENYREVSLLATASKILTHIINNRLKLLAKKIFPETQVGFI